MIKTSGDGDAIRRCIGRSRFDQATKFSSVLFRAGPGGVHG